MKAAAPAPRSGRRRLLDWCARIGLLLLSTTVALVLGELVLRTLVNPGDFLVATLVDDPILGQRIAPHTTGHDALGLRNATLPSQANVVAIGDSQTYGVGVSRDSAWPQQLGSLLQESVYNMALGGYGPLEYLHLATQQAKKLRPRLLIVGFYFGNDLAEACRVAHQRPHWKSWREPGSAVACDPEDAGSARAEPKKRFALIRDWLARHSVLYSMLRTTLLAPLAVREKERIATELPADAQWLWQDPANPALRTIFTSQIRLSALDTQRAHVREGLRIAKRAFALLKQEADAQGAHLLVVLIPTKEGAYCRHVQKASKAPPAALLRLCDAEESVRADLLQFLAQGGIAHVDVRPRMEDQVRQHAPMYPPDADGHPRASGHAVIARSAYDAIRHYPEFR